MSRYAFYFDSTRCVGCKTCMVACRKKNNLPSGYFFRRVSSFEVGEYPRATFYHWSRTCNHCENPACVNNCPTGAMYRAEDGTVQHNDEKCIGCESCVNACPYEVPVFIEEEGIVGKCNACADTRGIDGTPTCVASCGMRALEFGEYEEIRAAHPDAVQQLAPMPDPSETGPSFFAKARESALDLGYSDLLL